MKKPILFLSFLFVLPALVFASEPEIAVRIDPPVIGIEEQATISVQLDRRAKDIDTGKNPDLEISYGGESHSSQVTIVNGVIQSRNSFIYTFILTPKKTGSFSIVPFRIRIDDKTYSTEQKEMKIKVVRTAQKKPQGGPGDIFSEIDEFFHSRNRIPSVSFKLVPRTVSPIQDQQVILDGYILTTDRAAFNYQFSQVADIRSDKCALYDITDSIRPEITRYNGQYRKLVKRYVIYPIESGKIGIAPPGIIAVTPYGQIQLKTEVIGIDSRKLTDGSGLSYVGELDIRLQLPKNRLETGKNGELKLILTGNGNLKVLSNPYGELNLDGLFLSAPVTETRFKEYRSNKAYFVQEVKYLLIAKKKGEYSIPPLVIRYFNDQGQPQKLEIPPQTVIADENEQGSVQKNLLSLRKADRLVDMRFILFNPFIVILLGVFFLLPFAALFYGIRENKLAQDPDIARKRRADKRFSHYFSLALKRLEENDTKGFYTAVQNSIIFFITDKLNLPSGTPYRSLLTIMAEKGIPGDAVGLFEKIWQDCNRNAFSGSDTDALHQQVIDDLKKLTGSFR